MFFFVLAAIYWIDRVDYVSFTCLYLGPENLTHKLIFFGMLGYTLKSCWPLS